MANTMNGMDYENVARIGLDAFADGLIPIRAFTTDLSGDINDQGTVVKTRIVPVAGTVGDLTDDHTGAYTDAIDDQTFSAVSVTLGSEPVIGWAFTDKEMMQISSGVMADTTQRLIRQMAYGVANKMLDDIFATIDTTYTAGVSAVLAADFDADDVADARADWVANGGTMEESPTLVLNPSYYAALLKDNAIQNESASGMDGIRTGKVPTCCGFKVVEAPSLPGAAVNNTVGFYCSPSARAIAMRPVTTQSNRNFDAFFTMVHPVTGVVLTFASWFDTQYRKQYNTFEAHWGQADAVTTSLRRITSA